MASCTYHLVFEHFILRPHVPNYQVFRENFNYLFNSYYYSIGPMHLRPKRGLLSRPSLETVMTYREHVDTAVLELLSRLPHDKNIQRLVTLGLNHEQQHQELLLIARCTGMRNTVPTSPLAESATSTSTHPRHARFGRRFGLHG